MRGSRSRSEAVGAHFRRAHCTNQRSRFLRAACAVFVLRQKPHSAISAVRPCKPRGVGLGVRRNHLRPSPER